MLNIFLSSSTGQKEKTPSYGDFLSKIRGNKSVQSFSQDEKLNDSLFVRETNFNSQENNYLSNKSPNSYFVTNAEKNFANKLQGEISLKQAVNNIANELNKVSETNSYDAIQKCFEAINKSINSISNKDLNEIHFEKAKNSFEVSDVKIALEEEQKQKQEDMVRFLNFRKFFVKVETRSDQKTISNCIEFSSDQFRIDFHATFLQKLQERREKVIAEINEAISKYNKNEQEDHCLDNKNQKKDDSNYGEKFQEEVRNFVIFHK